MARPRLVYPFMIAIVIAHLCSCTRYKYTEYYLENDKICHILNEKRQLDIRNGVAAIVSVKHMFDRWMVKSDRNCTFVFKTEKGEGLFAVIHKMFLRTKGDNCLDYIRFKKSDGQYTSKFCGEIDRSHTYSYPVADSSVSFDANDNYDKFTEYDPIRKKYMIFEAKAAIETEIVISKEEVPRGWSLDLTIIYTPYKSCNKVDLKEYAPVGFDICIRREYVCDKMANCPLNVCSDERNCEYSNLDQSKEDTATKVTVGAVTTMILCFIIFVMCLWICKKSHKLCWSSDCAGPNVCSRPTSLSQDVEAIPNSNRAVPTAPMLEVAVSSPVVDKDLPPSYDSLFPEQSNPART
ncbi:uncharacterized protein LOC109861330 isoform X2 [Pseudomyrmex gracilis]|uniref:uncharacterized protein LOC109861330 isoform X2 n=1 Tax=Pseudomyrmex gracilis TaxID=219809 RepID=UPI000994F1C9|nr:uncharacterized protein LOC109861330 isoform X2 [Pseudomyrmex gracilis]